MSLNIAKKLKGPCVVSYKQADFLSQNDVTIDLSPTLFDVNSSAYGVVDQRIDDQLAQVQITPMGIWGPELLKVYNDIAAKPLNDYMAQNWKVEAVVFAANQLTLSAHDMPDGSPVRLHTIGGVIPGGLAEATLYYSFTLDANTITLHPTQQDGIDGTNTVAITDAGSGFLRLIEQQPLRITSTVDGSFIEFHNAVVSQLAGLSFGATVQLFGQMAFRAFPKFGVDRATANSVYTEGTEASTATFNPASVITQPYTFGWGASPWDSLEAENGITMNFNLTTGDDAADSIGTGMLSLQNLSVDVQAQPAAGLTEAHILAKTKLQGAGAVRGASLSGDDLDISGTGVFARLANARLTNASLVYSATNQRIAPLTWTSGRTVTAGVADPLFLLGTAAP